MSGEGGGLIAGLALVVGAGWVIMKVLPFIIAGACVYGVIRAGIAIAESVEINSSRPNVASNHNYHNSGITQFFDDFSSARAAEKARKEQIKKQNLKEIEGLEKQLAQQQNKKTDINNMISQTAGDMTKAMSSYNLLAEVDKIVQKTVDTAGAEMQARFDTAMKEASHSTCQILEKAQKQIDETAKLSQSMVDWTSQKQADRMKQQTLAKEYLEDAEAALNVLTENKDLYTRNVNFIGEYNGIVRALNTAKASYNNGAYQAAVTESVSLISRITSLLMKLDQEQKEIDELRENAAAMLSGVIELIEGNKKIEYGDQDLDFTEFLDPALAKVSEECQKMLKKVKEDTSMSNAEAFRYLNQAKEWARVVPQKLNEGKDEVTCYLAKYKAGYEVASYMTSQGYGDLWYGFVNDNKRNEYIVHLTAADGMSQIAVVLDAPSGDPNSLKIDVHYYYDDDETNTISEKEKEMLRQGIVNHLQEQGLIAGMQCTGAVNHASSHKEYNDPKIIKAH